MTPPNVPVRPGRASWLAALGCVLSLALASPAPARDVPSLPTGPADEGVSVSTGSADAGLADPSAPTPDAAAGPNDMGAVEADALAREQAARAAQEIMARGPQGFRGLAFGASPQGHPDLEYLYGSGDVTYYRRTGDNLEIGEVRLKDILYGFYQGSFFHVQMRAREPGDIAALKTAYAAKYGPPLESVTALDENYLWDWPEAQIALDRDRLEDSLSIAYTSLPFVDRMQRQAPDPVPGDPVFLRPGLAVYARRPPPDGFGGIPFGAHIADLSGLDYLFVHKDVRHYRRTGEARHIGDIRVDEEVYSFRDDMLFYVILVIKNPASGDFERLREAYEAKYGAFETISPGTSEHLVWSWPAAAVALIRYRDTGSIEICYAYTPVLRDVENRAVASALSALAAKTFGSPGKTPDGDTVP